MGKSKPAVVERIRADKRLVSNSGYYSSRRRVEDPLGLIRRGGHRTCLQGRLRGEPARLILEDDVQGVDDAGNETQDGQGNVDEQVGAAATLEEDSQRGQDDGEDNLADVAGSGQPLVLHLIAFDSFAAREPLAARLGPSSSMVA